MDNASGVDLAWIENELTEFIEMTKPHNLSGNGFITSRSGPDAPEQEVIERVAVIEAILDKFFPTWRDRVDEWSSENYRYRGIREAATRCRTLLRRQSEIADKLGSTAPTIRADQLHPWIWEAARPQWEAGHHAEAVHAAAKSVNSRLQQKLNRRDVSDTKLIREAFTENKALSGASRLRVSPQDDSATAQSIQAGVHQFGAGCFMAIRNPVAHLVDEDLELSEQEALERLAAFSLLARWIDDATLTKV